MTRLFRDAGGLSGGKLLCGHAVLPLDLSGLINRDACDEMRVFPCGARAHDPGRVLSWVTADGVAMFRCNMDLLGLFSPRSVIQGLNPNKPGQ
jgi:hypothetical protein